MKTWLTSEEAKAICRHRALTNQYIHNRMNQGTPIPKDEWMRWAHEYDATQRTIRALARQCDGAKTNDSVGFNKYDAVIGRQLASRIPNWNNEQFWTAVRIARKYKKQIKSEWTDWIPQTASETKKKK